MISSNFKIETNGINMAYQYITMVKGDTLSFGIVIVGQDGEPMDIDSAIFIAKKDYDTGLAIFEKTLGNGIEKEEDGLYTVRIDPEDTINEASGRYYYGFRLGVGDDIYTFMHGILELEPMVEE